MHANLLNKVEEIKIFSRRNNCQKRHRQKEKSLIHSFKLKLVQLIGGSPALLEPLFINLVLVGFFFFFLIGIFAFEARHDGLH